MRGYIPINLDLSSERHSPKYYYIITKIYYAKISDRRNLNKEFIPLNAKTLSRILGGRYVKYLKRLLELQVIETNGRYVVNQESKGYRLTQEYASQKFRIVDYEDRRLEQKIMRAKQSNTESSLSIQSKYIYKCLRQIKIDYDAAVQFIEENINNNDQYVSYHISIDLIDNEDWFFVQDTVAGRIHNNVTNLPRVLRKYINVKKSPLIEIDIANSQPFLMNVVIQRYLEDVEHLPYGNQLSSSYPDIEQYKNLTSSGKFYEFLMQYFPSVDRDQFKKQIFGRIFFNDDKKFTYNEWFVFQDIFPKVAQIISYYKKDNYKNLAIMLQRIEAGIIINKIVPELALRKIFILTIHDSILTTPENVECVKEIILIEFGNNYGLIPTIKIKGRN